VIKKRELLKKGFVTGFLKGWQGFLWLLKIMVPISFLTALFVWTGWVHHIDALIRPVMGLLYLPPVAAFPLLIGMFSSLYGAIAAMAVLPLTKGQMTLLAIILLSAHCLIQESVIQGKSGLHPLKAVIFRLLSAIITVIIVAQFLDTTLTDPAAQGSFVRSSEPFLEMFQAWFMTTFKLTIKIFFIIMFVLILLEIFRVLNWISPVVRISKPFLKILGLDEKVGTLWIIAAIFGLGLGAAAIVEEAKEGNLTKKDLEGLHLSIGINHSLIEDPALFLPLGLSPFWLWVPRLIMAMVAVRLLTLWQSVMVKHSKKRLRGLQ
jgi:spore maturation protein SpmB